MFTEQKFRDAKLGEENYSPTEIIKNYRTKLFLALRGRSHLKLKVKDELLAGISQLLVTVTPGKCRNYINHISRVLPVEVERNGKASGF